MGKVNNALRMLAILRSRGKVTRQELAEELEVNPREITRYKEDLESAGVTITNIKGKYGGYVLESKDYLLNLELSNDEELALNNVVNHLKIQGNYLYKDLESIRDKIAISKNEYIQYQDESVYYSNSIKLRININDERDKWLQINDAIINNKKLSMKYKDSMGNETERIVCPYGLYSNYGANFFIGFCEKRQALRTFKFSRISSIELLKEKFERPVDFNIKEYFKSCLGVFRDDFYDLELKIYYPYAQSFKEIKRVDDEVIEDRQDEGYLIYKAVLSGKNEIINWIMGMADNCLVISPKEIRDTIGEKYKKMLEMY